MASGGRLAPLVFKFEDESVPFSEITVSTIGEVSGARIKASIAAEPLVKAVNGSGTVYKYLKIEKENIHDSNISSVTLVFTVENSWLSDNSLDSDLVVLKRLESEWKDLPTKKIGPDTPAFVKWDIQVRTGYEARSPGLSTFAIVGYQKPQETKTPQDIVVPLVLVIAFMVAATVLFVRHHHKL